MAETKKKDESKKDYDEESLELLGLDGPKPKPKKPVFYFQRIGLVIPIWAVLTLEKDVKWEEKPKVHPVYGIVINRGMEPSQMCPIGEKAMWYEKEDLRDSAYEAIIGEMNRTAFNVITV